MGAMLKRKLCFLLVFAFLICAGCQKEESPQNDTQGTDSWQQSQSDTRETGNTQTAQATAESLEETQMHETKAPEPATEEVQEPETKAPEENPNLSCAERAHRICMSMTTEEKVGQMFIVRCPGSGGALDVSRYKMGGYILFARDFSGKTKSEVIGNIQSYQAASAIPLLIGVDEEGGTVTRVSRYTEFRQTPFLSPQDLFAQGGYERIVQDTLEKCALLGALGINLNLAPVCDIATDPSDYMYKRSFAQAAGPTSEYIRKVVTAMDRTGVGCVLKHFPGYGNNKDTHTGIAYDSRPYAQFESADFLPFQAGIDAGAGCVMVSHNIVECMDGERPASLSARVHEILRNRLGFEGVIMTDDLYMDAIRDYIGTNAAAVEAVLAGNDMLCCTDYEVQIPAVIDAVNNGSISMDRINSSVERILRWKIELGIIP